MLLPDFPQGMGGVGAALNDARSATSPVGKRAPHPGVFTHAERRTSRQAPNWETRDCSRNIARDDLRDVSIAASLADGHCVVYIRTLSGRNLDANSQIEFYPRLLAATRSRPVIV